MWLVDSTQINSGQWCCSQWAGLGIPGASLPSAGDSASPVYPLISLPADAAKEYRTVEVSVDAGLTVAWYDDGSVLVTAAAPQAGRVTYEVWEDGVLLGQQTDVYGFGGVPAQVAGSASIGLGDISLAAVGSVSVPGSVTANASIDLGAVSVSADGAVRIAADAAVTFGDIGLSASGIVSSGPPVVADAGITLGDVSLSAAGTVAPSVPVVADAAIQLGDVSLSASGSAYTAGVIPSLVISPVVRRLRSPRVVARRLR